MITLTILILIVAAVFIIAFASPKYGTRAQRKSNQVHHKIEAKVQDSPKPVRHVVTEPAQLSRKVVTKSAEAGKKSRKKLSQSNKNER